MPQVIFVGTGVAGTGDINGRPASHSDVQPVTKTAETIRTADMRNRYGSLMLSSLLNFYTIQADESTASPGKKI